ncbi:MAG: hypothetical protein F4Z66_00220 [Gammaproteobacteria bacterium]|nr:hypothetical protein [Gammaproteobacteria bacterium]
MPSERKKLRLPSGPDKILEAGVKFLDQFWDRSQYEIGGGTVLAARWHHRHSTDVDCSMNEETFRLVNENESSSMISSLGELEDIGALQDKELHSRVLVLDFTDLGQLSLVAGNRLTRSCQVQEYEVSTGIRLEPTAEILAKKIAFRVLDGRWKQRDFFDLVVSSNCEPEAYKIAIDVLTDKEKNAVGEILRSRLLGSTLEIGDVQEPFDQDVADSTWDLAAQLLEGKDINLPSLPGRETPP